MCRMDMSYKNDGYLLIKNLFDSTAIDDLRNDMTSVFREYTKQNLELDQLAISLFSKDFEAYVGCCNICQNLPSLYSLSCNQIMLQSLSKVGINKCSINTKPLVSFSCISTAKDDNYWKVPAHQDWPSTQGSINAVTCWVPLVDVTDELGPLEVCPGSHKFGFLESHDNGVPILSNEVESNFVLIHMNRGDALFFSNFLIHRSGTNKSAEKIRLTTHFRYDDYSDNTFIERKYPRHKIEKRKEGILFPGFPNKSQINAFFNV